MAFTDPNEGRMSERRHELYTDLMDLVLRHLAEYGVGANEAALIASALADRLADHWAGQNITFPKEYKRKLTQLEAEIYQLYQGYNLAELAQCYDISERGLRKLIDRVTKRIRSGNQHGLFDSPPSA